jgi:CDP-diacylglycerol--serine O-phosphatidyltransferase
MSIIKDQANFLSKKRISRRFPRRRVKEMPLFFLLPNFITIMAACSGLSAIKFAMDGFFGYAVTCILVAVILDGLDGATARFFKASSKFGAQLDSLADLVNFGVSPAMVMYYVCLKDLAHMGWMVVIFFITCLMLRLSRFNVATMERSDYPSPQWRQRFSVGLPAPTAGYWCLAPLIFCKGFDQPWFLNPNIVAINCLMASFLMISRIPTILVNRLSIKHKSSVPLIAFILLFLGVVLAHPWNILSYVAIVYVLFMPFIFYRYLKEKKKHSTRPLASLIKE